MRSLVALTLVLASCAPMALMPPGPLVVLSAEANELPARDRGPTQDDVFEQKPSPRRSSQLEVGRLVARAAEELLHEPLPAGFHDDCSGFTCAAAAEAGLDLPAATKELWALAEDSGAVHHRARPAVGDLAFFDDTWDRDGNGRTDDPLTHVGVVVEVQDDGTVLVAHRSSSNGRTILRMNLLRPHDRFDESGKELNDYLRRELRGDPPGTRYLAGELCRGFATPGAMGGSAER